MTGEASASSLVAELRELAAHYLAVHLTDNAQVLAERATAVAPGDAASWVLLAEVHIARGRLTRAHSLLAAVPPHVAAVSRELRYLLGWCCVQLDRFMEAEEALAGNPSSSSGADGQPMALAGVPIADLKAALGRGARGDSVLPATAVEVATHVPGGPAGMYLLGTVCRRTNREAHAAMWYRAALAADPYCYAAYDALGELGVWVDPEAAFAVDANNVATAGGGIGLAGTSAAGSAAATGATTAGPTRSVSAPLMIAATPIGGSSALPPQSPRRVAAPAGFGGAGAAAGAPPSPSSTPIGTPMGFAEAAGPRGAPRGRKVAGRSSVGSTGPGPAMRTRSSTGAAAAAAAATPSFPRIPTTPRGMSTPTTAGSTRRASTGSIVGSAESKSSTPASGFDAPMLAAAPGRALRRRRSGSGSEQLGTGDDTSSALGAYFRRTVDLTALESLKSMAKMRRHVGNFQVDLAVEFFQTGDAVQYNSGYFLQQLGMAHMLRNDFKRARVAFEQMRQVAPDRVEGLEMFSTTLWHLKDAAALAALAHEASQIDKLAPQTWCVVGNCFSLHGEHQTALQFLKRAIQLDRYFTYAHTLEGHEHISNGDMESGIASYRSAIQSNAHHYNAWYGLGGVYHRQEKLELAEVHYRRALTIFPSSSVLHSSLGNVLHDLKRLDDALRVLSNAIVIDKENTAAVFRRAQVYVSLNKLDSAAEDLQAVIASVPREPAAHLLLAKNRLDEAIHHFNVVVDLDPKQADDIKNAINNIQVDDTDEDVVM